MPTGEQLIQDLLHPHIEARASLRLTPLFWAKKLKQESNAKITKTIKVKGAPGKLPRGVRCMVTTGLIIKTQDGDDYADGESVLAWEEKDWGTRQRARMDAMKLDNAYPAEKQQIAFDEGTLLVILEMLPQEVRDSVTAALRQKLEKR